MARETKSERLAREAAEAARVEAYQAEQYLPRLMTAMEEATKLNNYELTVVEGAFKLYDRDAERRGWEEPLLLSPVYSASNWDTLESLEWNLKMKADQRAESARRTLMKNAALAKLSAEERELLGL